MIVFIMESSFFMIVQRIFSIRHTDIKLTVVIAYMKLF